VRSHRIPADLAPNALARARRRLGRIPLDLTVSNPTRCGFAYPEGLLDPLRDPSGLAYDPDPKGLRQAREAVAAEYARHGVGVDPERIVLAASSSEAYEFVFKALCDPGDTVLVPAPSYPLFEHLAALDGLGAVPYPLDRAHRWQPMPPSPRDASGARAAVLVHPNNPTGSWVDEASAERLALARGADAPPLPLVVDEVFLDFPLDPASKPRSFATRGSGVTYTLGGLSKSRGLPQLKLSWIVVAGRDREIARALEALEFVADAYLSVGTPVQLALPEILARAEPVRDAILARCRENLASARAIAGEVPAVEILPPDAGWSVVLRFPRVIAEEALALELLERRGVAVHPGYFFDFAAEGFVVASLLPPPETFARGFRLLVETIGERL